MPFLKKHKISLIDQKIEKTKRNGWRHAVFDTCEFPKNKYIGQWKDDKREGYGLEFNKNNFLYRGDWLDGMRHGFGTLTAIITRNEAKQIYVGSWCRGEKHGYGIHWYNGFYYKGYFSRGKRCGYGQMWWNDGRYYEGTWKNNLFHGNGILITCNGNQYNGLFVNGKKEGHGTFYHMKTGQIQYGLWNNDKCVSSVMEDSSIRQISSTPTPYPIPPLLL